MHTLSHTASASPYPGQQCVEIILWEIYFLHGRKNILSTLSAYALDGARFQNSSRSGILPFRCLAFDWEKTIKPLLLRSGVPFEVVTTFNADANHSDKKKVYLVDGDLETLFAVNHVLEEAGYDVLLSHSARPLMEEILPPTDLFILDKSLPDGDGLEVYNKLRKYAQTKDIPVIMISASHATCSQAMAAGVDGFLEKPFRMKELLRIVSKLVN